MAKQEKTLLGLAVLTGGLILTANDMSILETTAGTLAWKLALPGTDVHVIGPQYKLIDSF